VYGDWFSSDTRAVIAILKHADIEHDFHLIDTLAQKNMEDDYLSLSPNGHIPMVIQREMKVLSQGCILFEWLVASEPKAAKVFGTEAESEDDTNFKAMSSYFFKELRTNTAKLIRRTAIAKLESEGKVAETLN